MNAPTGAKGKTLLTMAAIVSVAMIMSLDVANAGISGSKHDLGGGGASQYGSAAGTTSVCVFCHTPHGSDTAAAVPLWNKALPASGTFTAYSSLGTSTYDATQGDIGSVSLACLSCHDGAQAMDSMINAPGSGLYTAGGTSAYTLATMTGTPTPILGKDLKNDHPISMAYAGGTTDATWAQADSSSAKYKDGDFSPIKYASINGNDTWWVDVTSVGTVGSRDKTDMVLYTRASGSTGAQGNSPFVECASCHDPHNSDTAGAASVAFLRIKNENSAVCLACHNK